MTVYQYRSGSGAYHIPNPAYGTIMLCGKVLNRRRTAQIEVTDERLCEFCRKAWQERERNK